MTKCRVMEVRPEEEYLKVLKDLIGFEIMTKRVMEIFHLTMKTGLQI